MGDEWWFGQIRRDHFDAIRKREYAASPGPWRWEGESKEEWPQGENSLLDANAKPIVSGWGYDASGISVEPEDAEFICHARADVKSLIMLARGLALALYRCSEPDTNDKRSTVKAEALALMELIDSKLKLVAVDRT